MVRKRKVSLAHIILMIIIVVVFLSFQSIALADSVPPYINYQGKLTDQTTGAPIEGVKSITFSLYNVAAGGTAIYYQTREVSITKGIFSVYLGKGRGYYNGNAVEDGIPEAVFTEHSAQYLGIKMQDSSAEMSPRQSIVSVAYAYKAKVAESVMGQMRFSLDSAKRNLLHEKIVSLDINPGWTTIATIALDTVTQVWAIGFVEVTVLGHTNYIGTGTMRSKWRIGNSNSPPAVHFIENDAISGNPPGVNLTTSGNNIYVQVSPAGNYTMQGTAYIKAYLARGAGSGGNTFNWSFN